MIEKKTIITSTGPSVDDLFDKRFGRACFFCLYNHGTGEYRFVENSEANSASEAGTKAAQTILDLGASKIVSGDFGPKAKNLLEKNNIQLVVIENDSYLVKDIIAFLKKSSS